MCQQKTMVKGQIQYLNRWRERYLRNAWVLFDGNGKFLKIDCIVIRKTGLKVRNNRTTWLCVTLICIPHSANTVNIIWLGRKNFWRRRVIYFRERLKYKFGIESWHPVPIRKNWSPMLLFPMECDPKLYPMSGLTDDQRYRIPTTLCRV